MQSPSIKRVSSRTGLRMTMNDLEAENAFDVYLTYTRAHCSSFSLFFFLLFIYICIVNLRAAHAKRVISRITPTSDFVYFNDARGSRSRMRRMRNSARVRYTYASRIKNNNASFVIFRHDETAATCVITYRRDSRL